MTTPGETPAETLRAAAARLREGVAHCAPESRHYGSGRPTLVVHPALAEPLAWLCGFEADTAENLAGLIWRARDRSSVLAARNVPDEMERLRQQLSRCRDEVISRHREADRCRRQLVDLCGHEGVDPGEDPHAALLAHLRGDESQRGPQ